MADPRLDVLTPQNSQIIFIDHQPQMADGVDQQVSALADRNLVNEARAAQEHGRTPNPCDGL